jgi:uncharacterized protein YacL
MVVWAIRVAFILVIFGVGYGAVVAKTQPLGEFTWSLLAASLIIGVAVILADFAAPRKKLTLFAGAFFGLLVGIVLAYALSFVISPLADRFADAYPDIFTLPGQRQSFVDFINLIVGTITCYLAISFVLQTKDDFRFIVPYVEFSRQTKGNRPLILDTSALIDGRVADVAAAGMFDTQLIVPRFVLNELQQVADSADKLKRNRGRRGLDVLAQLQKTSKLDVAIHEASHLAEAKETRVDQLIMMLATELNARVITTDFNLNKVAQVGGVDVINMNELANALKAEVLPGERRRVHIDRHGEQANQGVGHLDDGTMVIVDHGKPHIGEEIEIVVTNTRQTSAGKLIFARIADDTPPDASAEPPMDSRDNGPPRLGEPPSPREPRRGGGGFSRSPRRGPPEPRS